MSASESIHACTKWLASAHGLGVIQQATSSPNVVDHISKGFFAGWDAAKAADPFVQGSGDRSVIPFVMLAIACGFALILFIGWCSGVEQATERIEREAIKRGLGEYVVDQESKSVEFRWREPVE